MAAMAETATSSVEDSMAGASRGKSVPASSTKYRFATLAILACVVVGATIGYNSFGTNGFGVEIIANHKEERQMSDATVTATTAADVADPSSAVTVAVAVTNRRQMSGMERLLESEPEPEGVDATKEDELVKKIAAKLAPVALRFVDEEGGVEVGEITASNKNTKERGEHQKRTLVPHQFLHLHHMKTGGTSIDRLLRCSMTRLKKEANYEVPYYSIHECSRTRFTKCLTDPNNSCRASMDKASVMSYCSALKFLDEFGWWHNNNEDQHVKAFTVLRHPVDRVWSMFRFQTKNCFKCQPLKEIYQNIEKGETSGLDKLCLDQLQNHEVNNLLSTEFPVEVSDLDIESPKTKAKHTALAATMSQEAIDNMKGFFTVIGITEELSMTSAILGKVFPWMTLDGSDADGTTSQCQLPHANASPTNNRCGEKNTHWELANHPDQETHDLIVKHNSLDMELYEAAVSYFDLQKRALGLLDDDGKK